MIPSWLKPSLIILIAWLVGAQVMARQEAPPQTGDAYPGQTSHARPPDGWYCSVTAKDEHHCDCHRVADANEMCEEAEPDVQECKTWCYAHSTPRYDENGRVTGMDSSHCLCPVHDTHDKVCQGKPPAPKE